MMKKQLKTTMLGFAVAAAVVMATPTAVSAGHGVRGGGRVATPSVRGRLANGGGFGGFGGGRLGGLNGGFGGIGGGGGLALGGGFYTGGLAIGYLNGRIPTPPYFSIHPPVYYSAPVPRTYGYSPFAYPGSVRTPDLPPEAFGQPSVINNPYCTSCQHDEPAVPESKEVAATTSKVITNPFVNQSKPVEVQLAVERK